MKAVIRLGVVLALPFFLGACILYLSAFPVTLSQVLAKKNLTATIPPGTGTNYQLSVATSGGQDFVILMNRNFAVDPIVVILDSNLTLVQTYSYAQLTGWGAFSGSQVMVDDGGYVIIGNYLFAASSFTTVPTINPNGILSTSLFGASFSSTSGIDDYMNLQTGGSSLSYNHILSHWTGTNTPKTVPIGGPAGNYNVVAAFTVVDDISAGQVILVLSSGPASYLISIPLKDFHDDQVAVSVGSLFGYPNASFSNLDSWSIGFAGNCLVAYSNDTKTLNRYSLTAPFDLLDKLPAGNPAQGLQYSYRKGGGYSVTFDPATLELTKIANWWNQ